MIGVILAAGEGRRLRPLTSHLPKALVPLKDKNYPCLKQVIQNLKQCVKDIVVVTGYKGEQIVEFLNTYYPEVKWVKTEKLTSGNITSFISALPFIKGKEFLLTNVDHIFPKGFFKELIGKCREKRIYAAVQSARSRKIQPDEMKVIVDKENNVLELSKTLEKYNGAYIGVTVVKNPKTYFNALERLLQEKLEEDTLCVEDVLQCLAKLGTPPKAIWMNKVKWFEIDTPEDLKQAKEKIDHDQSAYL